MTAVGISELFYKKHHLYRPADSVSGCCLCIQQHLKTLQLAPTARLFYLTEKLSVYNKERLCACNSQDSIRGGHSGKSILLSYI